MGASHKGAALNGEAPVYGARRIGSVNSWFPTGSVGAAILEDSLRGQLARGAHHAATGVGARAALVVAVDRGAVLAPARRRPEEVHLRCEELAGKDVAFAE